MSRVIERSGQVFGRLKVLHLDRVDEKGHAVWVCLCACGNKKEVRARHLVSGATKSCGCISKEVTKKVHSTHGMSKAPEYKTWDGIKYRCNNESCPQYNNYGGRGITVCDRWLESFENFYEDMGKRPSKKHSIERLDVNKGYSPDNCIWATHDIQSRNKRISDKNKTKVTGVTMKFKNNQLYIYRAEWVEQDGYQKTKSFSINKYGKQEAFRLACQAREDAIKRLNEEGAGYSENHGK